MPYIANAAAFLIQTLFDFLIGVFLVRAMLIAVNASFYDPICQFVYKVTNPAIAPLRRFLPRAGKIETASIAFALALALIELVMLGSLAGMRFSLPGWLLGAAVTATKTSRVISDPTPEDSEFWKTPLRLSRSEAIGVASAGRAATTPPP